MSATAGDIAFSRLGDAMAIAVEGLDLHRTPDDELAKSLRQALLDNLVLCIRGQSIGPGEYLATIATFGEPLVRPEIPHVPGYPAVTTLSSDDRDTKGDGKRLIAGSHWHSDDTFMAEPCSLTCLYGIEIPGTGGDTEFANMYAAYEALPTSERRHLDTLRVVHMMKPASRAVGRTRTIAPELLAARPPVVHPLVRTHPETGRKSLYIGGHVQYFEGMTDEESQPLIDFLMKHSIRPEFTCRFRWRTGSMAFWDNRCVQHFAINDYPAETRIMHRITVCGDTPF
jgi:taurine dioxygenase